MRMVLVLTALALAPPAFAQEVDLELVLLADASGSISDDEIALQREGYAQAITAPEVLAAIGNTTTASIAVAYVEWAADQQVVADWRLIDGPEAAAAFARELTAMPRLAFGRNAIGSALLAGRDAIEGNSFRGLRRVIDFSGDSVGNFSGPSIAAARAEVLAAGITINGLPILCRDCATGSGSTRASLADDFRDQIIGGPGAFVIAAETRESFAGAVRRKLVLEIAGQTPEPSGALPVVLKAP